MASTLDILKSLSEHRVQYVLIGGMACVIHGSQVVTQDVDICAPLTLKNLSAICEALKDFHPRFRMSMDLRPLPANPEELMDFKNLYLVTDLGQLDILSEVDGVGEFIEVQKHSIPMDLAAVPILVLDLETLILAKKIMNTPKDRQAVIELSAIRERLHEINKK
jgi:hypothetical protein